MSYLDRLFKLEGKVVAITGAGGMLCGEMARAFGEAGCKVLVLDKNEQNGKAVVDEIVKKGGTASFAPVDVMKRQSFVESLQVCMQRYGRVDVLINGAGINAPTPFFEIKEEEWDSIVASHLRGTFFGCQVFGEQMVKQGSGSIMNISSASAGPPLSKAFAYSCAKSGVKNLTQNLAREWGTAGVRVNALRPGFFPTEWSKKNFITPERQAQILGHTPMKRYGEPRELIGATLWLASEAATFVTGAEIEVDGGFTAMTI